MEKLFAIYIFLLFITSCKEDPIPEPNSFIGEAIALKNGVPWTGEIIQFQESNTTLGKFVLRIHVYNTQGFLRENFSIKRLEKSLNTQEIDILNFSANSDIAGISANYTTIIDDGDVVGDDYGLDTLATDNFIQITNVDTAAMEISGIFNVAFVLERKGNGTPENPPVEIRFTEGKFTTQVEQEWFE